MTKIVDTEFLIFMDNICFCHGKNTINFHFLTKMVVGPFACVEFGGLTPVRVPEEGPGPPPSSKKKKKKRGERERKEKKRKEKGKERVGICRN